MWGCAQGFEIVRWTPLYHGKIHLQKSTCDMAYQMTITNAIAVSSDTLQLERTGILLLTELLKTENILCITTTSWGTSLPPPLSVNDRNEVHGPRGNPPYRLTEPIYERRGQRLEKRDVFAKPPSLSLCTHTASATAIPGGRKDAPPRIARQRGYRGQFNSAAGALERRTRSNSPFLGIVVRELGISLILVKKWLNWFEGSGLTLMMSYNPSPQTGSGTRAAAVIGRNIS